MTKNHIPVGYFWNMLYSDRNDSEYNTNATQEALLLQKDRATRLSVEILQLQNIAIMWHYLRDPTFSRFYRISKCDRHTHTDRRTNRYTTTTCTALSIASRGKNREYCTAHQV